VIPDNILEECLDNADAAALKFIKDINKKTSFKEIKEKLRKEYDSSLFNCLYEKNCAQLLKPNDKSDLTTTKIELRKAECIQQCEKKFSD